MKRDYLTIGSSPCDEPCAQVGTPGYDTLAPAECERFVALLRKKFGEEPPGATICVESFPHDFGCYHEVVVKYYPNTPSEAYALLLEGNAPAKWSDDTPFVAPPPKKYYIMAGDECIFQDAQGHPKLFDSNPAGLESIVPLIGRPPDDGEFDIIEATCEGCTGYSSMPIAGAPWCMTRGTRPDIAMVKDGWSCFRPRGA